MIQVDGLVTRLSFVDRLDLLLDLVRDNGVKVEIKIIAVVAKQTEGLHFWWQIRAEINIIGILLKSDVIPRSCAPQTNVIGAWPDEASVCSLRTMSALSGAGNSTWNPLCHHNSF